MAIKRYSSNNDMTEWLKAKNEEYMKLQKNYEQSVLKMVGVIQKLSDHLGDRYQECVEHVNQYLDMIETDGNWINNGDGTFTAKKGATLWELQQATGREWTTSDYQGDPKKLQIGKKVSFAAINETNNYNTIDSTIEAANHYYKRKGAPANIGPNTISVLKSHPEQLRRQNRITSGLTQGPNGGSYGVDLTREKGTYYIGNTNVDYYATYGNKFAVIDFTGFARDGCWDITDLNNKLGGDGPGPKHELIGGKVYPFVSYKWTISVTNPYL